MKPLPILTLLLTACAVQAQEFKHEPNGTGLKLSVKSPGGSATAVAGGGEEGGSTESSAGAKPENGITRSRESTVYSMHNGKWIKVTRKSGRYGGDEVTVTSNEGGKEKVEHMSYAAYERKYLGKKPPQEDKKPAIPKVEPAVKPAADPPAGTPSKPAANPAPAPEPAATDKAAPSTEPANPATNSQATE